MKIWKYSGVLLIATGIIHTIVGIILGWDMFMKMIRAGLFNSIQDDFVTGFVFWFFICGLLIILLGYLAHIFIKETWKPLPVSLGYSLLAITILGCIIVPASGFWLFIPQALIVIFAKRRTTA